MSRPGRLLFLPAALAATLAAFLFWRWMGEPVPLPDVPGGRLQCLSYTPFEPGDISARSPGWVSDARIADDLRRLRPYTDCLRVYTPLGTTPRVVAAAQPLGYRILLGAWIGSNLDQNEREIAAALDLARRYPQAISAIVVGNEVLLRREMSAEKLAALIRDVREQSPVPVAYADVAHFIELSPAVADAADLLLIHLLPYWDDPVPPPVGAAVEQVVRTYADFRDRFPGKRVMIGETGWPSKGRMRGPGKPGLVSEARFVRDFAARAATLGIDYNLIEAIDQPWKRPPEGTVGGYWGILDQHRQPKFSLTGPVSGWPQWRRAFLGSAAAALAALAAGLAGYRSAGAWVGLAALSVALGIALVFQWDYLVATSQSYGGWAGAAFAAAAAVAATALLDASARRRPRAPVASLAELGRALRQPRSLASPPLLGAAFVALVMLPAAWIALTLAFAPRHRDIPIAWFALPALAIALRFGGRTPTGRADRREEAVLAGLLLVCGTMQLEASNPETLAWFAICILIASPFLRDMTQAVRRSQGEVEGVAR